MFARHVTMQLKNEAIREYPRLMETEILPLLRKQKGFVEEFVLTTPNQNEALAISLWEEKEHAEKYNREVYPEVVKLLNKHIVGAPIVKNFEVEFATIPSFEKFAKHVTV